MVVFCPEISKVFPFYGDYLSQLPVVSEAAANTGLYSDIRFMENQVAAQAESGVHHADTGNRAVAQDAVK